jgi:hypothetical protein
MPVTKEARVRTYLMGHKMNVQRSVSLEHLGKAKRPATATM